MRPIYFKKVLIAKNLVIPSWTNISIEVNLIIPSNKDFIFFLAKYSAIISYNHIIDAKISKIFVQNNLPSIICII